MRITRYPGDADPTSLALAEERRLVALAMKSHQPSTRKALQKLVEDGLVDRISVFSLDDGGIETLYLVYSGGGVSIYGSCLYRETGGNWGAYGLEWADGPFTVETESDFEIENYINDAVRLYRKWWKARENPRYPGDADPTDVELAEERSLIAGAFTRFNKNVRAHVDQLINEGYVDAIEMRVERLWASLTLRSSNVKMNMGVAWRDNVDEKWRFYDEVGPFVVVGKNTVKATSKIAEAYSWYKSMVDRRRLGGFAT